MRAAFDASWYVASAYDDGRLVGTGRVVSDGLVHAMVYDLIVLPEFQGMGIGAALLDRLVRRCTQSRIRDIQLFCARGKRPFYEKRGFVARPTDAPGMQYVQGSVSLNEHQTPATEAGSHGVQGRERES